MELERRAWWVPGAAMALTACAVSSRPPGLTGVDDVLVVTTPPADDDAGSSWVSVAPDDATALDDDDDAPTACLGGGAAISPWQMHRATGPICFGRTFTTHGDAAEYDFARVPAETDPGWTAVAALSIDFSAGSSLCGRACTCLDGGEFTYFQTFLDVVDPAAVRSLVVSMAVVDDGARVSVYNAAYPAGVVRPGSYVRLGEGAVTTNLAAQLVAGRNRVVITHVDDCCSGRVLRGVRVVLNRAPLRACS